MLNFIAIDLQLYKTYNIVQVPFFLAQSVHSHAQLECHRVFTVFTLEIFCSPHFQDRAQVIAKSSSVSLHLV